MKTKRDLLPDTGGLDLRGGPRAFTYDLRRLHRERAAIRLIPVVVLAGFAYVFGPRIPGAVQEMGWLVTLSALVMLVLLVGGYLAMFLAMLPFLDDAIRRADENVTVSEDGIRWEGGGRVVEAAWKDVKGCRRAVVGTWLKLDGLRVVETTNGPVTWNTRIDPTFRLGHAILRYSGCSGWQAASVDLLGPDPEIRETQTGQRIHHYRNRDARALLVFTSLIPGAHLTVFALARTGLLDLPPRFVTIIFVLLTLSVAYGWWRYRVGRVVLDERGVTQQGLFGAKTIVWSEVRAVRAGGGRPPIWTIVEGACTRMAISMFLVDAGEMVAEIRRRAGLSVPPGTSHGLD